MRTRYQVILIVAIVLGVYYPTLFAPINSIDDPKLFGCLLNNELFSVQDIFLPKGTGSYYRPLLFMSFLLDKFFWGIEESFYHLTNILIHLTNCLILYVLIRKVCSFSNGNTLYTPLISAVFFAIHPLNTEPVNWISGRTDLLAGFFLLLTMYLMLMKPLNWNRSLLAAICMLMACLAKETAIFFLPAALLFPFFFSPHMNGNVSISIIVRRQFHHLLLFSAAGSAYFAFRTLAFSKGDEGIARVVTHVAGAESAGMLTNLRLIFKALGFYVKKILFPFPLNFGIIHVSDIYAVVGILISCILICLVFRRTFTSFLYICSASVGCSALIIPLLNITWTPLAERYMYIPLAFFVAGTAMLLQNQCINGLSRKIMVAIGCFMVIIAFYGTVTRNILWQDNLALFQDTFRKSPDFTPARNEIANALNAQGRKQEAAVIYKSFVETNGLINAQYGLKNKALTLMNEGNFTEARDILRQLLANPGKHEVSILLQVLELNKIQVAAGKATNKGVYAESVKTLTRLIELTGDPFYSYRLGIVHMQVGERQKAIAAFNIVVRTSSPTAYYRKPAEKLAKELAM